MNFAIPRNNNSEMLLYIWKIIDIPTISQNDLLYKISFELFLFPPNEAISFINNCLDNQLLVKDNNLNFTLSKNLNQQLKNWQKKRKKAVLKKIVSSKQITQIQSDTGKEKSTNFNVLINSFTDKGTLNRSVSISDTAFEILECDSAKGILKSRVKGSKEESYIIEINTKKKLVCHNCHDFVTRRADNKKFCKHLTKLFLLLKDKDETIAEFFLSKLAENINTWDFTS
ncbi:MAG: hypothetical protein KAT57_08485 [Candidatus Lokiarchaeota archaeon]|nr:hypothetical protein [Candidatus Lokiarchaeota archaeon]MCK4780211.1 hypothetical protein [Candidatus Lokiarchaeota archaeon]